jgi:hypothetical protein
MRANATTATSSDRYGGAYDFALHAPMVSVTETAHSLLVKSTDHDPSPVFWLGP